MAAAGHHQLGALGHVLLAQRAHVRVSPALRGDQAVLLSQGAVYDQVRVVQGLPKPHDQIEHVRVIMQKRVLLHIRVELCLALHVHRGVEVPFLRAQTVLPDADLQRRQPDIRLSLLFRSAEQYLVEHISSQLLHGRPPCAHEAESLDGSRYLARKVAPVLCLRMPALAACGSRGIKPVVQRGTITTLLYTEVVRVRVEPHKAGQGVELANAILQGGARQAPARAGFQRESCLRRAVDAPLDAVRLV
mmetsp:Transcript_87001/g.246319  ORF Transcript_87001/g.246319 Transcript_87001/m.246319 type:complete len:247 (+) Transcript_87001:827-1567(+)